jgi:hypothetical protein
MVRNYLWLGNNFLTKLKSNNGQIVVFECKKGGLDSTKPKDAMNDFFNQNGSFLPSNQRSLTWNFVTSQDF